MTYSTPEITVLGDAATLIQGAGNLQHEPDDKNAAGSSSAGELDD